jgi:hypothetical protein
VSDAAGWVSVFAIGFSLGFQVALFAASRVIHRR